MKVSFNFLVLAGLSVALLLLAIALEGCEGCKQEKMKYGKPGKMKYGKPEKMKFGKKKYGKVKSAGPMVGSGHDYNVGQWRPASHEVARESRVVSVAKILADAMKNAKPTPDRRHADSGSGHQTPLGATYNHRQDDYELRRAGQQRPQIMGYPAQHQQQPPMMNDYNYYNHHYDYGAAPAANHNHYYPYNQQMQPGAAHNYQYGRY